MARLTLDQISRDNEKVDPSTTVALHLSHRALSDVSYLSSFGYIERLDLSFNCLSSLEDLTPCARLKWLSVAENKLESLKGIERLTNLMVFNAGKNKLRKIDEIGSVPSLRALILNDNKISSICNLDQLNYLNTLVLSKNPIYDIGDSLMKARSLTKLSLSHCHLEKIGSSLTSCVDLKELRLAHNNIATISSELAQNSRLLSLDMGNNLIENLSELKVISALPHLRNLNLQGNPIAEEEKLLKKVKQLAPNLRIFNAKPMEARKKSKFPPKEDTLSNIDPLHNAVEAQKKVERKKSKKDTNMISNDEVEKISKRKSITNQNKEDVNDPEAIFFDQIGDDDKNSRNVVEIIERKKKKKDKSTDLPAFQLLSSNSEVGLGGPSTWDD